MSHTCLCSVLPVSCTGMHPEAARHSERIQTPVLSRNPLHEKLEPACVELSTSDRFHTCIGISAVCVCVYASVGGSAAVWARGVFFSEVS